MIRYVLLANEPDLVRFEPGDTCGFWFNTPDGVSWAPGDSRFKKQLS